MKKLSTRLAKQIVLSVAMIFLFASIGFCFGKYAKQPMGTQASGERAPITGKVVETMNAGGYTYVCLEKDKQKTWAAMPSMEVKVGDEMSIDPGNEMGPFTSKVLNRTFDKIVFSGGPVNSSGQAAVAMPEGHPAIPSKPAAMPAGHPEIPAATAQVQPTSGKAGQPAPVTVKSSGTVVETFDSGGYTYICLVNDGQKSWAAVPPVKVEVGSEVAVRPGMEMGQFTSKTLNRTFDNIVFSPGIQTN